MIVPRVGRGAGLSCSASAAKFQTGSGTSAPSGVARSRPCSVLRVRPLATHARVRVLPLLSGYGRRARLLLLPHLVGASWPVRTRNRNVVLSVGRWSIFRAAVLYPPWLGDV